MRACLNVFAAHLTTSSAGLHVKLTEDEMKYLEQPYQPVPIAGLQPKNVHCSRR